MTHHCLLSNQQDPQILDQNAWWNMISSVYNFLSASTALAQALDHKYRHPEAYNHFNLGKPTVLTETGNYISLEDPPDLSEVPSRSFLTSCDDIIHTDIKSQIAESIENVPDKSSILPLTDSVIKTDNEVVERELISVHKMESFIDEHFEKQQESIYSKMTSRKSIDSFTEDIIDNAIAKSNIEEFKTKDTECETIQNCSEGSCFSLYSNLDSYNLDQKLKSPNTLTDLIEDKVEIENDIQKPCSSKVGVSFNCNTPEEFPVSQTEIKPTRALEKSGSNRCSVTWLTACTPYTKQPSLNLPIPPMKSEEMQTVTNRRFNGMLKTQITKAVGLDKLKNQEIPKNKEERFNVNRKDLSNQVRKIAKMVSDLEKETNEYKLKPVSKREPQKVSPKKKTVPVVGNNKYRADPLETLSVLLANTLSSKDRFDQRKFEVGRQIKRQVVVNASKNTPNVSNSKESKCETYAVQPPTVKMVNIVSKNPRKKIPTSKSQGGKSPSQPSSKSEKIRTPVVSSRPASRRASEGKNKKQADINSTKGNHKNDNVVFPNRANIDKKFSF